MHTHKHAYAHADMQVRALFAKKSGAVGMELFVKRASRMRSPMQLDLMAAGDASVSTDADAAVYTRLN